MAAVDRAEMSFLDHLAELRKLVVQVAVVLLLAMSVCIFFAPRLQLMLLDPLQRAIEISQSEGALALLAPTEGFVVQLRIAFFAGLVLASPINFLLIWRFFAPALKPGERTRGLPLLLAASLFFLLGVSFGWYVMGYAVGFFLQYGAPDIPNAWSLDRYIRFVTQLCLAFGLVFQLPVVIHLLARLGIVGPRTLARYRRHAILAIVIVAAALTPPDPFSQMLLAVPVYLLFEISILLARLVYKPRQSEESDHAKA